jgi:environmental stress-induced protein Ves
MNGRSVHSGLLIEPDIEAELTHRKTAMTHSFDLRRAADLTPAPWKNGGGSTREIAAGPSGSGFEDFAWRASIADVGADGPFSRFAGIDRTIVLVGGNGMALKLDGAAEHRLERPFVPFAFRGEAQVWASLIGGATQDFNLMIRRELADGDVTVLHDEGTLAVDAAVRMLFVARGRAGLIDEGRHTGLDTHDTALLRGAPVSLDLGAGAVVFAIRIRLRK